MLLYIAATNRVVSAVVVAEREEGGKTMQKLVYYLSEVLSTSKQNYPHYQKMTYGVYMVAKKLKHYFQEHPIRVVAEAPISEIISNNVTPRLLLKAELLCICAIPWISR
jgi:ethanolamine utilization protein EutA (predicted chaperonin)